MWLLLAAFLIVLRRKKTSLYSRMMASLTKLIILNGMVFYQLVANDNAVYLGLLFMSYQSLLLFFIDCHLWECCWLAGLVLNIAGTRPIKKSLKKIF